MTRRIHVLQTGGLGLGVYACMGKRKINVRIATLKMDRFVAKKRAGEAVCDISNLQHRIIDQISQSGSFPYAGSLAR